MVFIQPRISPLGALVLFVKKKDGSIMICIDYHQLNKVTINKRYHIPRVYDFFDQLQGENYFSKINCRFVIHKLRVREANIPKLLFEQDTVTIKF